MRRVLFASVRKTSAEITALCQSPWSLRLMNRPVLTSLQTSQEGLGIVSRRNCFEKLEFESSEPMVLDLVD